MRIWLKLGWTDIDKYNLWIVFSTSNYSVFVLVWKRFTLSRPSRCTLRNLLTNKVKLNNLELYYHSYSKVIPKFISKLALRPVDEVFTESAINCVTSNCEDHSIKFNRYRRELKNVHNAKMLWYVLLTRDGIRAKGNRAGPGGPNAHPYSSQHKE